MYVVSTPLEINTKRCGVNWKVATPLPKGGKPIMIVGCCTSNSGPDEREDEPTFVGFVASTKPGDYFKFQ